MPAPSADDFGAALQGRFREASSAVGHVHVGHPRDTVDLLVTVQVALEVK